MSSNKIKVTGDGIKKLPPATTPLAREQQITAAAYRLAEKRILDGTATSQEVTFFLKLGTETERLNREKLSKEVELLSAKTESVKSTIVKEELFKEAIAAMRMYSGNPEESEDE